MQRAVYVELLVKYCAAYLNDSFIIYFKQINVYLMNIWVLLHLQN